MCPHLSANYVLGCPSNMAQVSVWAGNLHGTSVSPDSNQKTTESNLLSVGNNSGAYSTFALLFFYTRVVINLYSFGTIPQTGLM